MNLEPDFCDFGMCWWWSGTSSWTVDCHAREILRPDDGLVFAGYSFRGCQKVLGLGFLNHDLWFRNVVKV